MSVIIKGMKMPKNCIECELRFIARGLDTECIFSNDTVDDCTDRRLYRCPCVEIPTPHGRLIDSDKIYDLVEQSYRMSNGSKHQCERDFLDLICDSPTILEAEVV